MNWRDLQDQREALQAALVGASDDVVRFALDGTISNARCFCWAALDAYDGTFDAALLRNERIEFDDPARTAGRHHAAAHWFLIAAHEAVDHVKQIESLLVALGRPEVLPPTEDALRTRLRVARNVLAEHTDERLVYWRLTGHHTAHVHKQFGKLGVPVPVGGIDSYSLGNWGGLIDPMQIVDALRELDQRLEQLAIEFQGTGESPAPHVG